MLGNVLTGMAKSASGGLAHTLVLMAIVVIAVQAITIIRRDRVRKQPEDLQRSAHGMTRSERLAIKDETSPSNSNQSCFRPGMGISDLKNSRKR